MGTILALLSALSYGVSDFVGGIASRRIGFARSALLGQLGGLLVTIVAAPLVSSGAPAVRDLLWGTLSGVGTGIAMTFLFRGIGRGALSVVVPISAVGGVALPVVVGTAVLGQHPPALAWAGIVLALPALWLVAGGFSGGPVVGAAIGDGLLAGVGIAVQYLALAQADSASGIWPVTAGRAAAVLLVGAIAVALGRRPVRRSPTRPGVPTWASGGLVAMVLGGRPARQSLTRPAALASGGLALGGRPTRRSLTRPRVAALSSGVLAAAALVAYLFAARTQYLAVAVVLSSLYPVVPVALGVTVLNERLRRSQLVGLASALGASVLIAVG
ncbi:EamA family transporter [Nocardia sp. NPDC004068]|uniref:EamA family transporter n=1 Tax=Nocardia sp. NPDC004068 TaxID=3364303 RepID=UPI0036B98F33